MKLAVFFPGIGYHCDKPLLYYSRKLVQEYGYEKIVTLNYTYDGKNLRGNEEKMRQAFDSLDIQAENSLKEIAFDQYEQILFISKSIGTIIASAYAEAQRIPCRHILYTPLKETYAFGHEAAVAFIGNSDPWSDVKKVADLSEKQNVKIHIYEGANHSLETKSVRDNLDILKDVMEKQADIWRNQNMKDINWAVLGTGVIANEMAVALKKNGKNIYAVGNRTYEKAVAFGEKYGIGKVYADYNEMFTDPEVDVIYITTPHNTHKKFMRQAIENGKHILVEKSITLNSDELNEMAALAEEKHVIIGEAMTIYHMPIYKKLKELLETGVLGKVNLITMNFGSFKEYDMNNRFFNRNLAGGAMLDIGVYALSFIRWFMDSKPDQLLSQVKAAPTGVDEQAGLLLMNQKDRWQRSCCRFIPNSRREE